MGCALLAAAALLLPVSPVLTGAAIAGNGVVVRVSDPVGDTTTAGNPADSRGDITAAWAVVPSNGTTLELHLDTAGAGSLTDAAWRSGASSLCFEFDMSPPPPLVLVPGNDASACASLGTNQIVTATVTARNGTACARPPTIAGTEGHYVIDVPLSCFDYPYGLDFTASIRYGSSTSTYTDDQTVKSAGLAIDAPAGYRMVSAIGTVYSFGDAAWYGNAPTTTATHIESTPSGLGYWVVDAAGHVFAFGDAKWYGNASRLFGGERVVSLSSTPYGRGYWLFTTRGRVIARGDAVPIGDMANVSLAGPIVSSAATPRTQGYYMVGSDGGVFDFGGPYFGSMGGRRLNRPVNGLVPTRDGLGYWLVASDGGVFAFGCAQFRGSMGARRLNQPVIGMVAYGNGYLMVASDGGIFDFSSLPFRGSLGANPPASPIVSVAAFRCLPATGVRRFRTDADRRPAIGRHELPTNCDPRPVNTPRPKHPQRSTAAVSPIGTNDLGS